MATDFPIYDYKSNMVGGGAKLFKEINMPALEEELIGLRREFHRYPELGALEFRTTARIVEELERLGLSVRYGSVIHTKDKMFALPSPDDIARHLVRAKEEGARPEILEKMRGGFTGCVAEINGAYPGPTICIRVDIDCNDLQETEDSCHIPVKKGFSSVHPECMHACGHDAHAAIGIGVAKLLCACRSQLHGKVVLIFQPDEEGLRGAASLTHSGVLSGCDYFFGVHVGLKDMPVGTVAASAHGFLAISKFDAVFQGQSAHAGVAPDQGKNALAAAATAMLNMLAIPRHHAGITRINVGTLHGGDGRNIIPSRAVLGIETRGANTEINTYMEKTAKRICYTAAEMHECSCEIRFMGGADSAECDDALVRKTASILSKVEGVDRVIEDFDFGASEDVVTMMEQVQANGGQATELIIGMPLVASHHNDRFDIDERVIGIGARCLAQLALVIGAP